MFTNIGRIVSHAQLLRKLSSFSTSHVFLLQKSKLNSFRSCLSFFRKTSMSAPAFKPPNILVYTGEDFSGGDPVFYPNVVKNINQCLLSDCYTIYLLTPLQVLNDPWAENLKLLVISCDNLTDEVSDRFKKYVMAGGKILNFGGNLKLPGLSFKENNNSLISLTHQGNEVSLYACKYSFEFSLPHTVLFKDAEENPRIIEVNCENSLVVVSDVHLEIDSSVLNCDKQLVDALDGFNTSRLDMLRMLLSVHFELSCSDKVETFTLTPCFLLSRSNISLPFDNSAESNFKKLTIKFLDYASQTSVPVTTEKELPVLYNCPKGVCPAFNEEAYFSNLKTDWMGQVVYFEEVTGTTMSVIESVPSVEGAVAVADVQILGKGRRGNRWITPRGSATFSAHFSVPLQSPLGQKLPIVQYFAVLALVKAIRETPGYEKLDVQIKWPNDIYYAGQIKIGGVIVNSTISGSTVHIYTGSGLNVSNIKPTTCINDIIKAYNLKTGENLREFTMEELIARSLRELEKLIMNYQNNDADYFSSAYYKYWMHTGQRVSLKGEKGPVTIIGIDQYGFLVVETENKKKIALQPDGNSFDIMQNLIIVREM